MFQIRENFSQKGFNLEDFTKTLLLTCQNHADTDKALFFAFILFDFKSPQIAQLLENRHYWRALNSISGRYISIFSINYIEKSSHFDPKLGSFSSLYTVDTSNDPGEILKVLLESHFGINEKIQYPAVWFFQVQESNIINYTILEIDAKKTDDAFLELKLYIQRVVEVLEKIKPENKYNGKEIFALVDSEIKLIKLKKRFSKAFDIIIPFSRFVSKIAKLT